MQSREGYCFDMCGACACGTEVVGVRAVTYMHLTITYCCYYGIVSKPTQPNSHSHPNQLTFILPQACKASQPNATSTLDGLPHALVGTTQERAHHLLARDDLAPWGQVTAPSPPVHALHQQLRATSGSSVPTLASLIKVTLAEGLLQHCALPATWPMAVQVALQPCQAPAGGDMGGDSAAGHAALTIGTSVPIDCIRCRAEGGPPRLAQDANMKTWNRQRSGGEWAGGVDIPNGHFLDFGPALQAYRDIPGLAKVQAGQDVFTAAVPIGRVNAERSISGLIASCCPHTVVAAGAPLRRGEEYGNHLLLMGLGAKVCAGECGMELLQWRLCHFSLLRSMQIMSRNRTLNITYLFPSTSDVRQSQAMPPHRGHTLPAMGLPVRPRRGLQDLRQHDDAHLSQGGPAL